MIRYNNNIMLQEVTASANDCTCNYHNNIYD